ncbi:MAG: hypothetical protein ACQET7_09500 [Thermodesulfobacteriota bacterium]
MEDSKPAQDPVGHSMLDVLDRTLSNHLERITGTHKGIHGLPMDLITVACIILMAEQAGKPGDPQKKDGRYRQSELEKELTEMGLADDQRLQRTLDSMVAKGYVEIDPRGGITPEKPAISMARLLEHAFPGMPGMNLVAYFVQTLDEVESGRKGAKYAIMQLDQMLRRHGAARLGRASKGTRPDTPLSAKKSSTPTSKTPSRLKRPSRLTIPAEMLFAASEGTAPPDESLFEPPPPVPEETENEATSETEVFDDDTGPGMQPFGPSEEPAEDASFDQELSESLEETGDVEPAPVFETSMPDLDTPLSGSDRSEAPLPGTEDLVDQRVAAFEEELAMQCPVCRKSSIEARDTAKGRTYYKCTDDQCMFISWGRPHHVACPLCGNSFLVESSSGEGSTTLKCPRATCRYRQGASENEAGMDSTGSEPSRPALGAGKPRRRVVRRRVLRKKR